MRRDGCRREAPRTRRPASTRSPPLAIRLGETLGLDDAGAAGAAPECALRGRQRRPRARARAAAVARAPARPLERARVLRLLRRSCSRQARCSIPQPLAMLLSLLALTTTAWMIVRRDYRLVLWAALALSLAGAQLVRSVSIWVVGVVLRHARGGGDRAARAPAADRVRARSCASSRSCCCRCPWYLHNQSTGGNAVFGRGDVADLAQQPMAGRVLSSTPACRT